MITNINQLDFSKKYSYSDYLTWKFEEYVELIKGKVLQMSPAPLDIHQKLVLNIASEIKQVLKHKKCQVRVAPFDVRFPNMKKSSQDIDIFDVVQPDICVICDPDKIDLRGCVGAPDMIIEVLSSSTAKKDLNEKFNLYQENKVGEYWVVFPFEKTINVYLLDDQGLYILDASYNEEPKIPVKTIPGFEILMADIFEN
ncbi:MAG: Uma2 family endonuclease [Bacteroidota bacterium]|nr:Uma2 family endonuclease [Bacteroidota bacterium]